MGFTYNPFTYKEFEESKATQDANKKRTDAENALAKYGNFAWADQEKYNNLIKGYENRPEFSYDFNADALYQQYKDKYIQQGKMAMADTMGQAAAMTGGYGNSYAATVGNQAYQAHLEQLNDVIPELYQLAYSKYQNEGQDMLNMIGLLGNERDFAYGQHMDGYNKLANNRDYYGTQYNNERAFDYGVYDNDRTLAHGEHTNQQGYAYNNYRDKIADAQWQADFEEAQRQFNEQMAWNKKKYEDEQNALILGDDDDEGDDPPQQKTWKDHDNEQLKQNQAAKGGSYYKTARSDIDSMIAAGKGSTELMSYAQEMVGNSLITKSEYMTLVQYIRNKTSR